MTDFIEEKPCCVAKTGDKSIAAVASPGAATFYGLEVLAENVQITDASPA